MKIKDIPEDKPLLVSPLVCDDLKETLEWELVDTSSMLTTHQEEGSSANFERYIA